MIIMDEMGGRTIKLFIPFEFNGKKIESITLAPMCFGHLLRWGTGDWKDSLALVVELAGVEEGVIRSLRYPDVNRVMEAFLAMMPTEIQQDIANGTIPQKQLATPEEALERVRQNLAATEQGVQAVATNGSGAMDAPQNFQGPGVPLPETGFDLSDEP